MKLYVFAGVAVTLLSTSCDKKERVSVEETRGSTTKDYEIKLFATSDERFRDSKKSPVEGKVPEGWRVLPSTQQRILNYRFGESGTGEVYVSITGGGIPENVDRWLRQFGKVDMTKEDFEKMERIPVLGGNGVWVEAQGEYNGGPMGGGSRSDYALAGVVVDADQKVLTVKMLGKKAEVEAEKQRLREFVISLQAVRD